MVAGLVQPLTIFLLGLGGGFLIPLLYRAAKPLPAIGFVVALTGMTIISAACLWAILNGRPPMEVFTGGDRPPFTISLRFGLWEGFFAVSVNVAAMLGAWHLWPRLRQNYSALLLYLILVMGINGMVMTRDLFNQFVFLEIMSIATYGLLGLERGEAALAASFKYIMATVLASSFFLLGSALLYHVTGTLNIDDMIEHRALIAGSIGMTALLFVLSGLIIELKPFPANGWGLDVYETAQSGLAALVSGGVSAGVFFALFKLLPLFDDHLGLIAISGGLSFLFSNLAGLPQTKVQRLLGYSSIAQMGLLTLALSLLRQLGADAAIPLVVGGLFFNHLFAKSGLFFLAGVVEREQTGRWAAIAGRPFVLVIFAMLLVAIAGLPPFPGFWAKWELVMRLSAGARYGWIALILVGSLLEAAYMFRWFKQAMRGLPDEPQATPDLVGLVPAAACAALLTAGGWFAASLAGAASLRLFLPLLAGIALYILDFLPGRAKCCLMLVTVFFLGLWQVQGIEGLPLPELFAALLLSGSLVVATAGLYRTDPRPGYYPLMAVMLLAIAGLPRATTSLEFFFSWELVTLSSYFLIAQGRDAQPHALPYLLFSLVSAFFVLAGFGVAAAATGTTSLTTIGTAGIGSQIAFAFLGIGFLVKAGALGVHVWLPGAYCEADDDLSAMLSAVVSKVAIAGLFLVTYLAIRSDLSLELSHYIAWVGLLTTLGGAVMALRQEDMKRMLAYSSMSQLGYIITAIALMSHLGWVTAFYLVANHLMVKGILFLAVAGVILRTGTRMLDETGGLARRMPLTFGLVVIALFSMAGIPPLLGFGAKWLLLSAMVDRGWYGLVALGLTATFVGFLYMFRLAYLVFLGPRRPVVVEAPLPLLLPQIVLALGIILLSFFPKLVMDPVSAAIDPHFAATLVWQGMSLEVIYAKWNPLPAMAGALALAALSFLIIWLIYRARRGRFGESGVKAFYGFYRPTLAVLTTPIANLFWGCVAGLATGAAAVTRRVYTGNGQTYALHIICYIIGIYLVGTRLAP
jgi:formate hydrogenlyase subunit 3/multisubunit Na+/H+ antiporter MnhD subunit